MFVIKKVIKFQISSFDKHLKDIKTRQVALKAIRIHSGVWLKKQ